MLMLCTIAAGKHVKQSPGLGFGVKFSVTYKDDVITCTQITQSKAAQAKASALL